MGRIFLAIFSVQRPRYPITEYSRNLEFYEVIFDSNKSQSLIVTGRLTHSFRTELQ